MHNEESNRGRFCNVTLSHNRHAQTRRPTCPHKCTPKNMRAHIHISHTYAYHTQRHIKTYICGNQRNSKPKSSSSLFSICFNHFMNNGGQRGPPLPHSSLHLLTFSCSAMNHSSTELHPHPHQWTV